MLSTINIAAYRFVQLSHNILPKLQFSIKSKAKDLGLKGTVLLSIEGINLFISGEKNGIRSFQNFLNTYSDFRNLEFKKSISNFQPFKKMLVKLKKEIITFVADQKRPRGDRSPFFGRETSTNNSLAKLYFRKYAPIIPTSVRRTGLSSFEIIYFPEFIFKCVNNLI
jgi:predicted sulfurtransferase